MKYQIFLIKFKFKNLTNRKNQLIENRSNDKINDKLINELNEYKEDNEINNKLNN